MFILTLHLRHTLPSLARYRAWKFKCGTGPYVRLMEEYPKVTTAFLGLNQAFRKVPADLCRTRDRPRIPLTLSLTSFTTLTTESHP